MHFENPSTSEQTTLFNLLDMLHYAYQFNGTFSVVHISDGMTVRPVYYTWTLRLLIKATVCARIRKIKLIWFDISIFDSPFKKLNCFSSSSYHI